MALLADGIHMGSHVLAIGLSWLAYIFIRKLSKKNLLLSILKKFIPFRATAVG
jgi:Co/Zn/Cd efflux system component